jgi:uncharacterized protein YkwD
MVDIIFISLLIGATIFGAKSHNPHHTPYLISLIVGFLFGCIFNSLLANYIYSNTGLDYPFITVMSFCILVLLGSIIFYGVLLTFYHLKPSKATRLYSEFSKANFITLPITFAIIICATGLLFIEIPININLVVKTQNTIQDSVVMGLSQKTIQGIGVKVDALKDVTILQQKDSSEEIVPLNFKSVTITYNQDLEFKMTKLINIQRAKYNKTALDYSNKLSEVARTHSIDMLQRRYFAHINLDGKSPFDRLQAAGISYSLAGENLAISKSIEDAVQALMKSPTHKANILNGEFHKTGIGIAVNQDGVMSITELFSD